MKTLGKQKFSCFSNVFYFLPLKVGSTIVIISSTIVTVKKGNVSKRPERFFVLTVD